MFCLFLIRHKRTNIHNLIIARFKSFCKSYFEEKIKKKKKRKKKIKKQEFIFVIFNFLKRISAQLAHDFVPTSIKVNAKRIYRIIKYHSIFKTVSLGNAKSGHRIFVAASHRRIIGNR